MTDQSSSRTPSEPAGSAAPGLPSAAEPEQAFAPTHLPKRLRLIEMLSAGLCVLVFVIAFTKIDVYAVAPAKISAVAHGDAVLGPSTVVPGNTPLEVEAFVSNADIGLVVAGQATTIKVDAFPYTLYGTVTGKVSRVTANAVALQGAASPASRASSSDTKESSSFGTTNLVYSVTVALDKDYVVRQGRRLSLAAGMTGVVEIQTGRRRIISYVLSPRHDQGDGS